MRKPHSAGVWTILAFGSIVSFAVEVRAQVGEKLFPPERFVVRGNAQDGSVRTQVLPPDGAQGGTWRIFIEAKRSVQGEQLVVSVGRPSEKIHRLDLSRFLSGAWTGLLPGEAVQLETSAGSPFDVAGIGLRIQYTEPETPVGKNNVTRFAEIGADIFWKTIARGVGRLSIAEAPVQRATSQMTYCTVFAIRPSMVMTSAHCVAGDMEDRLLEIWFDYMDAGGPPPSQRFSASLKYLSWPLDAAVFALDREIASDRLLALSDKPARKGTELVILQHYGGAELAVSDDDLCKVESVGTAGPPHYDSALGREVTIQDAGLLHACDTSMSSSGSPVIDRSTRLIIGMHRAGYVTGDPELNHAIRADYLLDWIETVTRSNE